jgi:hypothetical protein
MMTLLRRPVTGLCAATLTAISVLSMPSAFSAPQQTVTLSPNGGITARRGETDTLFTVRGGIFEPGWAFRGATLDSATGTMRIAATTAGSKIDIKQTVEPVGKTLRVSMVFTADKDTPVNSTHVSVSLPVGSYVGGKAEWKGSDGTKTYAIPPAAGLTRITEGKNGALTLAGKNSKDVLTVAVTGENGLLLQDGRVFGGSELEIRVGGIAEHVMKAGQAETVSFTIELPETVTVENAKPLVMQAGADWIPLVPKTLDIVPGSALDFSAFLSDAPAGKYGRLVARRDGHFAFEKRNTPQRFYGVNLCFSANYLEHDEADKLAERLMRLGYNTVRIHHYEGDLIDQKAPDSLTFRPEQLDKLDYLLAACKKRGLYIKTDLFVSRPVKPSEMGLSEGGMDDFKDAVLVSKPAMENWKAFSRKLLDHVNPYTKLAYKDEPALAWISLINEPNLTNGRLGAWKPDLRAKFESEWKAWYGKRYPNSNKAVPELPRNMADDALGRDVAAFFAFLHKRGWDEMSGFLRNEIGTKTVLTYLNGWSETPAFMATRDSFDFVDNHFYWDHPSFLGASWGLPSTGASGNSSAVAAGGAGPDAVAMTRLYGKPFTVSEWDYVFPNRYRAEGGMIMGAVSALQDWDAIWRFAYSHGRDSVIAPRPADYFNMAQDPLRQASERTGVLLFLRGDAKTSSNTVTVGIDPKEFTSAGANLPKFPDYRAITQIARVGVSLGSGGTTEFGGTAQAALDALRRTGKLTAANSSDGGRQKVSDTQQLFISGEEKIAAVVTPRTHVIVGPEMEAGTVRSTGAVTANIQRTNAVISVSSLDSQPVGASKRLLITHLTDLQNTNQRFSSSDRRILEAGGNLPYLVRRGSATLTLKRKDGAQLKAWRLDTTGRRVAAIPVKATKDSAILELSTLAPDGIATLYYEVVAP